MREETFRSAPEALVERARMLLVRHRATDAERLLREALAFDPTNVQALFLLSCSIQEHEGREAEALETLDRAIALEPEAAFLQAQRAILLCRLKRLKEAHTAAEAAMALDPEDATAIAAKGLAYLRESRWREAEEWARKALAVEADDALAQNVLTQALLWQDRREESEGDITARLARDPENAFTHFNAGYAALKRNDHKQAETHFLEALRLDPEFEPAREGLLESFRARNAVYRAYLRYAFAMAQLSDKTRTAVLLGVFLGYRLLVSGAKQVSPLLAMGLALAYFLFATWSYVARGVGSFFVLTDQRARQALRLNEKLEAIFVGGGVVVGLLLIAVGFATGHGLALLGGFGLLASAIPLALTLTVRNRTGRLVYGAAAAAVIGALLFSFGLMLFGEETPANNRLLRNAIEVASFSLLGATLLASFGFKRE